MKVRTTGKCDEINDPILDNHTSKKKVLDRSSIPEVSKVMSSSLIDMDNSSDLEGGTNTDNKDGLKVPKDAK